MVLEDSILKHKDGFPVLVALTATHTEAVYIAIDPEHHAPILRRMDTLLANPF